MTVIQLQYEVPPRTSITDLKSRLQKQVPLHQEGAKTVDRAYYDTVDWRLHGSGSVLELDSSEDQTRLVWRALGTADSLGSLVLKKPPRFVWDFPTGSMRERLEPILEMRALVAQATVRSRVQALQWQNKDGKTVLRAFLEEDRLLDTKTGKTRRMGKRLRIVPIKGYPKPLRQVQKLVDDDLGLAPASEDPMLMALRVLGKQPAGHSSKLDIRLEPDMRADAAAKRVLETLLDAMEANETGTKSDLDSEFLHDFRVAVRRTRSALSQIKGVLPQRILERFQPDFGWLGQVTGPTRDMHVYLLKFDDYRDSLPANAQADLGPLHDFLVAHQKTEHRELVRQVNLPRYGKLVREWRKYLESPLPTRASAAVPNAGRPILDVASERIWKVYRRVIREGQAITPASPAEDLHELRKTCKKLRYLMEFFQNLYPTKEIKALIKALKVLQDNLGDFQDLEVQAANLTHFGQEMVKEGVVPPQTLMAMGILVDGLAKRQHQAREEFAARFGQFAAEDVRAQFQALFAAPAQAAA